MTWNRAVPSGTISPCASTVQLTSNFDAIQDWWGVEHYDFSDTLSGRHKVGIAGVMLTGTNAAIEAFSTPGTGALTFDNTCGVVRIYRSTNEWKRLTEDHYSRLKLTTTNQSLDALSWTDIVFDTEVYDSLSEYTSSTLRVKGEGYYLIIAKATFPSNGDYEKAVGIYVGGVRKSQAGGYGTRLISVECADIIYASANDLIDIYAYNGHVSAVTLASASIMLTRLS